MRLRTRIAGFPFVISDDSFFTEGKSKFIGCFVNVDDNPNGLPFEIRSYFAGEDIHTIFNAALSGIDTLRDRLDWTANSHDYFYRGEQTACTCESCRLAEFMFVRVHMAGRKNLI